MTRYIRTHDSLYLQENRYKDPKQLHFEIVQRIKTLESSSSGFQIKSILDAGCAAGEFAYLLRDSFPECNISGFDLLPELISKAIHEVEHVDFYQADVLNRDSAPKDCADIVTCTGVLSIFDTFEKLIDNLITWAKPGGTVFLHSLFNTFPFDVQVHYNPSALYGLGPLESGWNIFSRESVSKFLGELKDKEIIQQYAFHDFSMNKELPKQSDLVRSWTFRDENDSLHITNGLMLLQPHAILEIKKAL